MKPLRIHEPSRQAVLPYDPVVAEVLSDRTTTISKNGRDFLLVPARNDELKVLRNCGYQPPAMWDYDWAGTEPFDVQKTTAKALVQNHRCYVLNEMGCFSGDTEYLTPSGWKRFDAGYSSGEVAQYHPDTGTVEFVTPNEYVKKPCDVMIHFKHSRGLDQMLSPEHRVLLDDGTVMTAEQLYTEGKLWEAGERNSFMQRRVPRTFSVTDAPAGEAAFWGLDIACGTRLMIAVIADGHYENPAPATAIGMFACATEKHRMCRIRIKKQRKKDRLRSILDEHGVTYKEYIGRGEDKGYSTFRFVAPWREKEFGPHWYDMNTIGLRKFLDEVFHWDGSVGKQTQFFSSSKASIDFVQYAAHACGYTASIYWRDRHNSTAPCGTVTLSDRTSVMLAKSGRKSSAKIVPTEDGFKYCFSVPSTFLVVRRNGHIFCSGNTGKTLASLLAYDYLRKSGLVRRMLVVAPLSIITTVWEREVFRFLPHLSTQSLWHPNRAKRLERLETDADIFICNHDGVHVIREELRDRKDIDVCLIDELTVCRNRNTQRWRAINMASKGRKFIWGLTGSPMPKSPMDAFGQLKMITPGNTTQYKTAFQAATMVQIGQTWLARPDAKEYVYKQMQPAVRFKRADCLDLPETTYSTRDVPLTPAQLKIYKKMKRDAIAECDKVTITAANAAVKAGKLLQIGCGFAYDEDKNLVEIPAKKRMAELKEIIDECENKLLVFTPFVASVKQIVAELEDYDAACVYGAVAKKDRDQIFGKFQHSSEIKVLVCHPAVTSHGLTLTAADTVVWFCPTYSLETYEQANARVTRPGQKNRTHIVHLQGTPTEGKIYKTLRQRGNMQKALLEMFEDDRKHRAVD